MEIFSSDDLRPYRDAIITKKLASMAFYRFGLDWEGFVNEVEINFSEAVKSIAGHK